MKNITQIKIPLPEPYNLSVDPEPQIEERLRWALRSFEGQPLNKTTVRAFNKAAEDVLLEAFLFFDPNSPLKDWLARAPRLSL